MSAAAPFGGQVALISGAAGGIGTALVRAFGTAGATAVGFDLQPPADGKDQSPAENPAACWVAGSVSDDADCARAVTEVERRFGRLDVLVHAAGVTRDRVLWKLSPAEWDEVQNVNLRGAFLLMRHAVPLMRSGGGGRIVLIGSINGSRGKFGQTAYAASKAGLIGLAKSAARETGRLGILVNVVEPGLVNTPMASALPDEARQASLSESLLGKMGEPDDIASAVLFLAGPGARHITGQILREDGGQYL